MKSAKRKVQNAKRERNYEECKVQNAKREGCNTFLAEEGGPLAVEGAFKTTKQ